MDIKLTKNEMLLIVQLIGATGNLTDNKATQVSMTLWQKIRDHLPEVWRNSIDSSVSLDVDLSAIPDEVYYDED